VKVVIQIDDRFFSADLDHPHSLAIGFGPTADNPSAFHIPAARFEPIRVGDFVGAVAEGGSANCEVLTFCAHGNGTHTECVGHITPERISVCDVLKKSNITAQLITVNFTEDAQGKRCIDATAFLDKEFAPVEALIVRTSPNEVDKKSRNWSGNHPPYFTPEAMSLLTKAGFKHLLTDLPSVDPEEDGGALSAHHIWWEYPENTRWDASITELIFVPDGLFDGLYLLQLVLPKIHSDAVPSNPLIYPLQAHV
jgi:kynurenine formamidase